MKHIKLLAALDTLNKLEKESEQPSTDVQKPVNWQAEYNKLRSQVLRLRTQLREALNPHRNDAEVEHDMLAVMAFCNSMPLAQGAVTCANLYNAKFFQTEQDSRFVASLCRYLIERYRTNSTLIEVAYQHWMEKANG